MARDRLEAHASAAIQRKDWPTAADLLRRLAPLAPQTARTWIELSYVESFLGRYRAAKAAMDVAAALPSPSRDELSDIIARLRTFNDAKAIHAIAARLIRSPQADATLLAACATQLSNLNDHALALDCAERAVAVDPGSIVARLMRGQILAHHGAVDRAADDLHRCVARAPGLAPAWWALARLRRQTVQDNHVPALRGLLANPALRATDVTYAAFALHKELDDLGDTDAAWQALAQACAAKRGTLDYRADDTRALVDALATMPATPAVASTEAGPVPVFIVGMHRSGTTLLEQLLDASPEVRGVGELYDVTSAMREATDHHCKGVIDLAIVEKSDEVDFAAVGRRYLQGMAWRLGGERVFTDKLPSNFLNIGFICRALPQARILHMVRDPMETCFSNLRELFSDANPYSYDQRELADYFLQYQRLMSHWHAVYPGRILDVAYDDLTADPEATMRRVAAFCGIDYVDAMRDPRSSTRAVATASAVQVRDAVVRREVPKWVPYARQLEPLVAALRAGGIEVTAPRA